MDEIPKSSGKLQKAHQKHVCLLYNRTPVCTSNRVKCPAVIACRYLLGKVLTDDTTLTVAGVTEVGGLTSCVQL